jgi:hypothetical protein
MSRSTVSYKNHNFMNFFFQIYFISVNDIVRLAITSNFKQSCGSLPQLDEDLPQTDYVDSLAYTFMDQWDKFRLKRRSSQNKLKWWFKIAITFYLTVGSCLNFYRNFHKLYSVIALDLKNIAPRPSFNNFMIFLVIFKSVDRFKWSL